MDGFLETLDRRVLVCDGAMGTLLYAEGVFLNRSFDELNLTDPALVASVHRRYVEAGAEVIETNTFGANRYRLANFGLADKLVEINQAGARLARDVAGPRVWVSGSIGPLGIRIEPFGRTSVAEATAAFQEQARALAEAGVDLFMLETFGDLHELVTAVKAIRAVSPLPVVAQLTTGEDGHTLDGTPPETFAPALEAAGADVIGLNCSVGPAAMLETIERMAQLTRARLSAQPNAGRPRDVDGRTLYLSSPEYLASYAKRFIASGVRLVGGCCGTTPEHTREIAAVVRRAAPAERPLPTIVTNAPPGPQPAVPSRERSTLGRALADKRFVVLAEVEAPRGAKLDAPVAEARRARSLGATAVNVPSYPKSGARAGALALATLLEQAHVETVLHYTCRDRSLIDIQSDLVGAHALGIRNLLLTTGSSIRQGSYADASSTVEVDAIGLVNAVVRLNQGTDIAGEPIGVPTAFLAGVTVNPFASHPELEWERLSHKVAAGAEFLMTPPVLDLEAFERVLPMLLAPGLPIVVGVAALDGVRHAEFLASEVVGVKVGDRLLDRLRRATDEAAEALAATLEIVSWLGERAQGIYITGFHAPAGAVERLLQSMVAAEGRNSVRTAQHG